MSFKFLRFPFALCIFASAASANPICRSILLEKEVSQPYFNRKPKQSAMDFYTISEFAREYRKQNIYGKVREYFDNDFDTQTYVANNALPNRFGIRPFVDPASRGVVIFFHGSGTLRSSGKNFIHLMNSLAAHNISTIAVDLPFHGQGPLSSKYEDPKFVTAWVNKIVEKAKAAGVPVYLTGHSFGPSLIMEYLYDYPTTVDGALLISPVSFNAELMQYYKKETSRMKFGGTEPLSETMGGAWGDRMLQAFRTHHNPSSGDPTQINPNLRVKVLTGDREEYAPAPLGGKRNLPIGKNTYSIAKAIQKILTNAEVTTEQGIGHYIFQHKDKQGNYVVFRDLLDLFGINMTDASQIRKSYAQQLELGRSISEQLFMRYHSDRLFKSWADQNNLSAKIQRIYDNREDAIAKRINDSYRIAKEAMEKAVVQYLIEVAMQTPEMAKLHKGAVEDIKKRGLGDSPLLNLFASSGDGD